MGCVNSVLARESPDLQAKIALGVPRACSAPPEFLHRVIHTEPPREARSRASPLDEDPEVGTRLLSRALCSAAEEPDQLLALAFG